MYGKIDRQRVFEWLGGLFSDRRLLTACVVFAAIVATTFFLSWPGALGSTYGQPTTWFIPSGMMACGHGFGNANLADIPRLTEFLEQKRPEIAAQEVSFSGRLQPLDPFQSDHRYLLYAIGVWWRLFGISWAAAKALMVVFFCVTIAIIYGLFRLATNRFVSLAGAVLFALSPLMLATLPSIRDFLKAPFILGALLLIGCLIKGPADRKCHWMLAAGLGLLLGLGVGFRRDVVMLVPPAVLAVLFCPRAGQCIPDRAAALALLALFFIVPGWPVLRNAGDLTYHQMVMGLATECDDSLGLERASYERAYLFSDPFAYASVGSYALRHNPAETGPISTQKAEAAGRALMLDTAATFPGDMLARAYAAVLRVVRDGRLRMIEDTKGNALVSRALAIHAPLAAHFERYGFYYAAAALILISLRSMYRATAVLLMLLYSSGYLSLKFEMRHCFHMGFVPLWFAGVLISGLLQWRHAPIIRRLGIRVDDVDKMDKTKMSVFLVRRAATFCAIAAALILVPFYGARVCQMLQMHKLRAKCASANLEPLPTEAKKTDDRVVFNVTNWPAPPPNPGSPWNYQSEYLVAELSGEGVAHLGVEYQTGTDYNGFPYTTTFPLSEGPLEVFFPVYEYGAAPMRSVFQGVSLPAAEADKFMGLYRVKNLGDFSLLPLVYFYPGGGNKTYQQLRVFDGR